MTDLSRDLPSPSLVFERRFGTDELCRAYVFESRFPNYTCPTCDGRSFRLERHFAHCTSPGCHHEISLTADSIFHGTKLELRRWFLAAYYLVTDRTLTAKRLAVLIKVTYKTAWLWARKLRDAAGSLLGAWNLRGAERPRKRSSRLQDADFADPSTVTRERWKHFCKFRGGPRSRDEDAHAPFARRFLMAVSRGHVSDKHLPAYLDHFVYVSSFRTRATAFAHFAQALPKALRRTYRQLVGLRKERPWLLIKRHKARASWSPFALDAAQTLSRAELRSDE